MQTSNLATIQLFIEILGLIAFALSGLIAGLRKKLDFVGVFMVTGAAAFGGGTLRDILLDRRPFFWVENSYWLWLLIALVIFGTFFIKRKHIEFTERAIQIPDALGLGLFSILGTQIAMAQQMPVIVAILMGVITAVFGGVLRDIVCSEVPKAFSDYRPYAVIAFLGSGLFILLMNYGIAELVAFSISFLFITLLRIVAIYRDWRLPKFD
jgi:uncharacterized membrane protein YeiH